MIQTLRFLNVAAATVACSIAFASQVWARPASSPLSALDKRPLNTTCLAGDAPSQDFPVQLQRVFQDARGDDRTPFDFRVSPVNAYKYYFITRAGRMYAYTPGKVPVMALSVVPSIGVLNKENAYDPGGSEQWGLVSFAFDPNFKTKPYVYVLFNRRLANQTTATSIVARYRLRGDGVTFDPASNVTILSQRQTEVVNHHFDHLAFGPTNGLLYISSGDGGTGTASQDLKDLRGKMLRLDVRNTTQAKPYAIPGGNPTWPGVSGARREIYALGLRNPWRFSLDGGTPWVADVGGSRVEEIDTIERGKNYGWNIFEGSVCMRGGLCRTIDAEKAKFEIAHTGQTIAVIGGFVYHGKALPSLANRYVFHTYGLKTLTALRLQNGVYSGETILEGTPNLYTLFEDADKEIYGVDNVGNVYKVVPHAVGVVDAGIPKLLSQTGCVNPNNPSHASGGMVPYSVNSPLWADDSMKWRWVGLPNNAKITILPDGDFDFPNGTVLMKTFFYYGRPHETRLLKRHNNGVWAGYTYQWQADLKDAALVSTEGKTVQVQRKPGVWVSWHYPSRAECLLCHTDAAHGSLGPELGQLNGFYRYPTGVGNQLKTWEYIGFFKSAVPALPSIPTMQDFTNARYPVTIRARSYLHANCSICHRPGNDIRADLDFRYRTPIGDVNACWGIPRVTDLGNANYRLLYPRRPDLSIMPKRMRLRGINQMPPFGTNMVDTAGVKLIEDWIRRDDVCNTGLLDSDGDGIPDRFDNCPKVPNASQIDSDGDKIGDACDGDYNNDGAVDGKDEALLRAHMNLTFEKPGFSLIYDYNTDGRINGTDLAYFLDHLKK